MNRTKFVAHRKCAKCANSIAMSKYTVCRHCLNKARRLDNIRLNVGEHIDPDCELDADQGFVSMESVNFKTFKTESQQGKWKRLPHQKLTMVDNKPTKVVQP